MDWREKTVLVTGGTGSFGRKFTEIMLGEFRPKKLVIFSRDELKQHEMRMAGYDHPSLRYFIGDVRDVARLRRAFDGVDVVVHAAALKQVPACEYNPNEAVLTNVDGTKNVIDAALDAKVGRVMTISSDKAVNPVNLYGATKLVAEKLTVQANAYSGDDPIHFSCVRYGNVVGSRGSVIPLFVKMRSTGVVPVTDPRMTRFWITLDQGVEFVLKSLERMSGGEIFVPKIPSMTMMDLARAIAPECRIKIVGIRPGEKLHEVMVAPGDGHNTLEFDDHYVIMHPFHEWSREGYQSLRGGVRCADEFTYTSDTNTQWLTAERLLEMAQVAVTVTS
jgi:UDP-N-acetylglucosamine 4,6-dehydratase/5-epimerase